MTFQPRQEPRKQGAGEPIPIDQHVKSSLAVRPLHEGLLLSPEEVLQEESQRLQQCIRELLVKNQQLRMSLAEDEIPDQEALLPEHPHDIRIGQSRKRSL